MTGCNATLTTATVEPCAVKGPYHRVDADCVCNWIDGRWVQIELHTLTCERPHPHPPDSNGHPYHGAFKGATTEFSATWDDDTPGATPHTEPLVSDAEIDAAREAFERWIGQNKPGDGMRVALEAAARVREAGDA